MRIERLGLRHEQDDERQPCREALPTTRHRYLRAGEGSLKWPAQRSRSPFTIASTSAFGSVVAELNDVNIITESPDLPTPQIWSYQQLKSSRQL
eukprot:6178065-Pleurochrysis_carterae.AAC.3